MKSSEIVAIWFAVWESGDYPNLPITEKFCYTSPFGKIEGRSKYISLVEKNKDKFLGYKFKIKDEIYGENGACVRYTAVQGDFELEVSEWYYFEGNLINSIYSYYHIGEIRDERKLDE